MAATHFDYRVFGLCIRSELPLPELFAVANQSTPDVTIRFGTVPSALAPGAGPHLVDSGLLLVIDEVARFFIKDGNDILIEPVPSAPAGDVRLFLLGSAMGALLHQRELLPLHANAVEIRGRAFAFMGRSGAGKSTLAAWFHDRGHRIIADDVCVVRFDPSGRAVASPGLPRLRLWKGSMEASGRDHTQFSRSLGGDPNLEKYDVPIARHAVPASEIQLAGIYLLKEGSKFAITALQGVDGAEALMANTYRGTFLSSTKGERSHWQACMKLLQRAPVYAAERRWDLGKLDEAGEGLLTHAQSLLGDGL